MWWAFVIIIIVIIIGAIASGNDQFKANQARADEMKQALAAVPDFTPTTKVIGLMNLFIFATDNEHQKVLFLEGENKHNIFNYEDVISVELIEDNNVISKKSTGRTIGGALLGGVVSGGVGAIVGGLSGSSKQQNLHSSVKVKVLLRNNPVPSYEISCYSCKTMNPTLKPVNDDDILYKAGREHAKRIVDSLSVIIDAVDRALKDQSNSSSNNNSIADEIAKLAILKDKGILTDAEFVAQKTKLLNSDNSSANAPLKLDLSGPNPLDAELMEIIQAEGPLKAIIKYKERTGADLTTAKSYIDSLL